MEQKVNKVNKNIKSKIIFTVLIAGGVLNDLVLRALTVGGPLYWKPIITSISMMTLIGVLSFLISNKRRNKVCISVSAFLGILNSVNYSYYKYYSSFISFSLFKQLKQFKKLGNSVMEAFDFKILIFLIPTIILIVVIKKLNKIESIHENIVDSKRQLLKPFTIGILLLSMVTMTLTSTDFSRLVKQWNRPYLVEQLGVYSYTVADFIKSFSFSVSLTKPPKLQQEEVSTIFEDLVEDNSNSRIENEYSNIFKGRDVYVIHYESAQSFAMEQEFSDGPVTPFLNKMASEGLYFDNFYPQHSVGTSSDSEFTFNTSLLPINNGTVFITHADREYMSLQKLLKKEGYHTMSMHGNVGDFWNRNIMYEALDYDRFYSKDDYEIDEEIGLGLSDMSFFRQSIDIIKGLKEEDKDTPIMATLITLTNHYPFNDLEHYGEFNVDHMEDTDIANYFKSFHYADKALQSFIEGMDKEGLLDNAVVVLYGDHHAKISKEDFTLLYNYDETTGEFRHRDDPDYVSISGAFNKQLKRTPFIIWTKDQKVNEVVSTPMGMVDALPTLGNMLGIFNPYQLGKDMMNLEDNTVVFPDGDWVNNEYFYSASSSKLYGIESNELIEEPEAIIAEVDVDKKIELSNNIIDNNLIRYFNVLLANNKPNGHIVESDIDKM